MQLKRRVFFVLLFIISFNSRIPNGDLESEDRVLFATLGMHVKHTGLSRSRPTTPLKIVKPEKSEDELPTGTPDETL